MRPFEPRRHAVVIVIDTLRADASQRAATPALDQLAETGTQVPLAWSAGTWTVPSVISMFTGMTVRQHGWDEPSARIGHYPPIPSQPTLAEVLREQGFQTTGLYVNVYLSEKLGFSRGFDAWRMVSEQQVATEVKRAVGAWSPDKRQLLYVHLLGPHSPVNPSPAAAARHRFAPTWSRTRHGMPISDAIREIRSGAGQAYSAGYHAVVEDTDARVAAILDALGPAREEALVLVTSDHGELLGDHDGRWGHGKQVWSALNHVPMWAEGAPPLPDALSTAAVPDIVTKSLGIEHTWPVQVQHGTPLVTQREGLMSLLFDGRWAAIWDGSTRVYDMHQDPAQQHPLPGREQEFTARRDLWLQSVSAGQTGPRTATLDPDEMSALEVLGYAE